jgi:hypothetical protein
MNVWWREGSVRPVTTEEELLAAVAEAEAEAEVPLIVTVEAPAGTLTLVVGESAGSLTRRFCAVYSTADRRQHVIRNCGDYITCDGLGGKVGGDCPGEVTIAVVWNEVGHAPFPPYAAPNVGARADG